jgi:multiple sugar transport system permease protein
MNFVFQVAIALFLAMLFTDIKYRIKGVSTFRILYYLPNLIAAAVIAGLFAQLLNQNYGMFNKMFLD